MQTRSPVVVAAAVALALSLGGCGDFPFRHNTSPSVEGLSINGMPVVPPPTDAGTTPATGTDAVGVMGFGTRESPLQLVSGTQLIAWCQAKDSDDDALTYSWKGDGVGDAAAADTRVLSQKAPTNQGTYAYTCVVTDDRGGSTSGTVWVTVIPSTNRPPTATLDPQTATITAGSTVQFACTATDPDNGDKLTYAFLPTAGTVTVDAVDPARATYTAPATAGAQSLYCVVSDGKGGFAVPTAKITVQ